MELESNCSTNQLYIVQNKNKTNKASFAKILLTGSFFFLIRKKAFGSPNGGIDQYLR